MTILSQFIPFSFTVIIPIVIQIIFNTITAWLSAQLVIRRARLQDAVIFASITYFSIYLLVYLPIPTLPIINTIILVGVVIKSLLAMKLFGTDFRGGLCVAGVQMLIGTIIRLSL